MPLFLQYLEITFNKLEKELTKGNDTKRGIIWSILSKSNES